MQRLKYYLIALNAVMGQFIISVVVSYIVYVIYEKLSWREGYL